ncbi:RHS repeat-associated core domain-containing protein [Pseudomonas sp. H11T01]|uniref:RHS repeat-associated core domain-containing protein n=1 Tax=Pseudomonas sp. H11T01 TaxID=3402749 RepID=UPI003AD22200
MPSQEETVLCRYHYNPLDHLVSISLLEQVALQRFYCKSRLTTEIQGQVECSIFQQGDQLLAQRQRQGDAVETTLLATDQQRSVLLTRGVQPHAIAYLPYGYRPADSGLLSVLGFNGERPDSVTGHYLLGNGHRAFNPVLMRFNSPDRLSPFGKGGINPYAYCHGDPVNFGDPTGQFVEMLGTALKLTKTVLKGTWKTYVLGLRPRPPGLLGAATVFAQIGSAGTIVGHSMKVADLPLADTLLNIGKTALTMSAVLKTTHKVSKVIKNGDLLKSFRNRISYFSGNKPPSEILLTEVVVVPNQFNPGQIVRADAPNSTPTSSVAQVASEVRNPKLKID